MAAQAHGTHPLDAVDPETSRHPQPMYRAMRDASPVLHFDGVGYLVTTRKESDEVLRDPGLFSSVVPIGALNIDTPMIPLQVDPPDHRKFRKLLNPLFSPPRMKLLEEPTAQLVNDLIDRFAEAAEIDFAQQFSVPFPSQVFLTMLGLPMEELPILLAMKDGIIRPQSVVGKPMQHSETRAYQQATAESVYKYFQPVLQACERNPRDDLLSAFLAAEIDGERLSRDQILSICLLFLIAGLDTVSASLDCAFAYLASHPGRRGQIVDDPSCIPAVIEELLRWETPVAAIARIATADTELGGCPIKRGESVMVMLGSANTDEADVSDADVVRWDRKANRHLAFGGGIHRCLGSHLARVELQVALRTWHERIPEYQIKPGAELDFTSGVRAVRTFPMLLGSPSGSESAT